MRSPKPSPTTLTAILSLALSQAVIAIPSDLEAAKRLYIQGARAFQEQNYEDAAELYEESLQKAWSEAVAANLCNLHLYGLGVKKDYQAALRHCEAAASAGNANAAVMLGEMHLHGRGVAPDLAKAGEYYLSAAKQDHPHAQLMIGLILWDSGTPLSMAKAKKWLRMAKANGSPEADPYLKLLEDQLSTTYSDTK